MIFLWAFTLLADGFYRLLLGFFYLVLPSFGRVRAGHCAFHGRLEPTVTKVGHLWSNEKRAGVCVCVCVSRSTSLIRVHLVPRSVDAAIGRGSRPIAALRCRTGARPKFRSRPHAAGCSRNDVRTVFVFVFVFFCTFFKEKTTTTATTTTTKTTKKRERAARVGLFAHSAAVQGLSTPAQRSRTDCRRKSKKEALVKLKCLLASVYRLLTEFC